MFENGEDIDEMTLMPFGRILSENTTPKLIDKFRNGTLSQNSEMLFADKFTNLFHCQLTVSTWIF